VILLDIDRVFSTEEIVMLREDAGAGVEETAQGQVGL